MNAPLLSITDAVKHFTPRVGVLDRLAIKLGGFVETRPVRAVDGVSLDVRKGETLGIVGESGCGKSTLGRLAAGILAPDSGTIRLDGQIIRERGSGHTAKLTTRIQTVFQDPYASLDPRMRIGDAIREGPVDHRLVSSVDAPHYVASWLQQVGMPDDVANRYPHQFSGGQRQRIAIARALAMQPDVLICDEPVASLDVSIQAQIINLFLSLRDKLGLTIVFISHDIGVVRHLSHRVAVMYLGKIVEVGDTASVIGAPQHPYTRAVLDSIPKLMRHGRQGARFATIEGDLPSPLAPPPGCHFHPRCRQALDMCRAHAPKLEKVGATAAACHLIRRAKAEVHHAGS